MTMYSPELSQKICGFIADGLSLRHIECIEGMPAKKTIMEWCIKHPEFSEQYAHAKEIQADAFAEELLDIVDDGRNDWIERESKKTGETYIALNEEAIARSRLRTDTRKWLMGKMKPKKYGDSNMVKHADANGEKLGLEAMLRAVNGTTTDLPRADEIPE